MSYLSVTTFLRVTQILHHTGIYTRATLSTLVSLRYYLYRNYNYLYTTTTQVRWRSSSANSPCSCGSRRVPAADDSTPTFCTFSTAGSTESTGRRSHARTRTAISLPASHSFILTSEHSATVYILPCDLSFITVIHLCLVYIPYWGCLRNLGISQ